MEQEKTKLEKFKEILGDKVKDIKQLFDVTPIVTEAEPAKFLDVKTSDGIVLRITGEQVAVGAMVTVVDETGENPAPDATYTLEDGNSIVTVGGAITEVMPATTEAEPAETVPAEMNNELAKVSEGVKSITYKYEEIAKEFESAKAAIEKLEESNIKLAEQNKAMFSLIEQMADLPTSEPTVEPKGLPVKSELAMFRESVKEMKKQRNK